jgi:hypothetical protein
VITPEMYARVRGELAAIFHWDINNLSPEQTLRLDNATPLRIALDDEQGKFLRSDPSANPARLLSLTEVFARLLPPAALAAPPPPIEREDPREAFLRMYFEMRERGGISEYGTAYDAMRETAITLAEEIEEARDARDARVPSLVERVPSGENVLTLSRPHSRPSAPAPTPAVDPPPPAYDYGKEEGWKDFINSDGTISPRPRRGHYWGPV